MQVLIFVKTVTGSATIGNVKEKIKYKESILSDQQHLIHLGRLQLLGVHPPSRVQDRRWFICRRPLAARPWSLRIKTRRSLCHSSSATGCISSSISGLLGSSARPALPFLTVYSSHGAQAGEGHNDPCQDYGTHYHDAGG